MTALPEDMTVGPAQLDQLDAALGRAVASYASLIVALELGEHEDVCRAWVDRMYEGLAVDLDGSTALLAIVRLLRGRASEQARRVIAGVRAANADREV